MTPSTAVASEPGGAAAPAVVRIRPTRGWALPDLRELWDYRELLGFLAWRDIKVRYKQTALGAAWAVLQPVLTMALFSIFFGRLAGVPSDGVPYPIFALTGLVPWAFFAYGVEQAGNSLVSSAPVIRKVYFPRVVIPLSSVLAGAVDFLIAFVLLLGVAVWYGVEPTLRLLALPGFFGLAAAAALGVALWLSALNVRYRDVRYAIPFLVQAWLFATPLAYPTSLISERWQPVYALNPMVGVVEGFRWSLLGTETLSAPILAASTSVAVVALVGGAFFFRRMERSFADVV